MRLLMFVRSTAAVVLITLFIVPPASAWSIFGHAMMTRLAGGALPGDVPMFMRTPAALDAMAYYGPEPDRWRSKAEPELNVAQAPEHFIDLEWADLGGPLPRQRYDFIRQLAAAQAANPAVKMTPENVGLLPFQTLELYERLKIVMRDYRALLAAKEDTKPAEAEIVFLAGWLGHYVEDGSNPMHTSIEYNGWVGPNPHGYTTSHSVHSVFERDFVLANVKPDDLASLVAAKPRVMDDVFDDFVAYLRHSSTLVEKTYQLEKAGGLAGEGTPESRAFVKERMAAGVNELRDMIYTAWVKSADPVPA